MRFDEGEVDVLEKSFLGREGFEVGVCLVCVRNSKEIRAVVVAWVGGRVEGVRGDGESREDFE